MRMLHLTDELRSAALIGGSGMFGRAAATTKVGRRLTGPIVALLAASACSNVGIMPWTSRVHDSCWSVVLPLSLSLTLLGTEATESSRDVMRRTGTAFCFGSVGSCAGAVSAYKASNLAPELAAPAASSLFASYVGGSANFFAVAQATRGDPSLMSALAAADVGIMAAYFSCLSLAAPSSPVADEDAKKIESLLPIPVACACLAASKLLARGRPGLETAFLAGWSVLARKLVTSKSSCGPLADICLHLFYASLGASASLSQMAKAGPVAIYMASTALVVHGAFLLPLLLKKSRSVVQETLLASNACIGGPSTAAAYAVSLRRPELVLPAVVWGTCGYAIATGAGLALHNCLLR